ncbi:MAG TPA: hypothetical protein ENK57_11975 [Polyangiaceae bacterium]|nr:hypothetical protein [Polyangiaceae bacterium]
MPMQTRNPRTLNDNLIAIETDGDYAPDFRRLVTDHRQRLTLALRSRDPKFIAQRRDEANDLLDGWGVA